MRSTDSMFLLYEEHKALLKGKRQKLAQQREAVDSLTAALGIEAPLQISGCTGCAPAIGRTGGVIFTAVGVILLAVIPIPFFISSLQTRSIPLDNNTATAALSLVVGVFFLVCGYHYTMHAYWTQRYPVYVRQLYRQLIAQGEIVEGTIIDLKQGPPQIIRYRFTVPLQHESREGEYRPFTQIALTPGQKVTVLYLNRFTNLLL